MRFPLAVIGLAWLGFAMAAMTTSLSGAAVSGIFLLWAILIVEYFVRLTITPDTPSYMRERWIEPLAVFFPPLALLHLVGMSSVTHRASALSAHFRKAMSHHSLLRVQIGAAFTIAFGAWVVFLDERHVSGSNIRTYWDSLWWAVVTTTTIGYGDHYPVSTAGRIVAIVLMLIGIGLIGSLTATVASFFVQQHVNSRHDIVIERLEMITARLADVERRLGASDEELAAIDEKAEEIAKEEE